MDITMHFPHTKIYEFVIMPNHVHGIIIIEWPDGDVGAIHELPLRELPQQIQRRKMLLPKIIGYFKMNSAKTINQNRNIQGWSVWQRNYYEHIIRNENELKRIRQYIINNPVNW